MFIVFCGRISEPSDLLQATNQLRFLLSSPPARRAWPTLACLGEFTLSRFANNGSQVNIFWECDSVVKPLCMYIYL